MFLNLYYTLFYKHTGNESAVNILQPKGCPFDLFANKLQEILMELEHDQSVLPDVIIARPDQCTSGECRSVMS